MQKAIILSLIVGFAFFGISYAQDAATTAAPGAVMPAPEAQEAYGEVVSVDTAAASIIITEYDYEKDEDVNNTYNVDNAATYENVKSLGEVKVGDWVALTLKPQAEGKNIATSVYVERYDMGEEAVPAPAVEPATTTPPAPTPAAQQESPAAAATTEATQ